jgi:hypothetical protein
MASRRAATGSARLNLTHVYIGLSRSTNHVHSTPPAGESDHQVRRKFVEHALAANRAGALSVLPPVGRIRIDRISIAHGEPMRKLVGSASGTVGEGRTDGMRPENLAYKIVVVEVAATADENSHAADGITSAVRKVALPERKAQPDPARLR